VDPWAGIDDVAARVKTLRDAEQELAR